MTEPLPVCHLNGEWTTLREARISPLDRGFLYADAVYEVIPVFDGRPFRFAEHINRLDASMAAIRLRSPHDRDGWRRLLRELITRNGDGNQYVYLQVSRGAEYGRNHAPLPALAPTVFAFCAPLPRASAAQRESGLACITASDTRWARCDIKSVALLANVLLRQQAVDAGAQETILLRDGRLTEASSSAVHVVVDGVMVTPPHSPRVLPGTTRTVVEELALRCGIPQRDGEVTEQELRAAPEILISSATRDISSVTRLDGAPVGDGRPGPVWKQLDSAFDAHVRELAGREW